MKSSKQGWQAYWALKPKYETQKALREHYQSMSDAWLWELRFELLQVDYLLSVMNELEVMTTDPLTKAVIKNTKERHHLDKLIHTRTLFDKDGNLIDKK